MVVSSPPLLDIEHEVLTCARHVGHAGAPGMGRSSPRRAESFVSLAALCRLRCVVHEITMAEGRSSGRDPRYHRAKIPF
jgi:hypothetical protein